MSAFIRNISWKELLLPMWVDLQEITSDSATAVIAANNVELAGNEEEYSRIIKKISDNQSAEEPTNHIVLTED